MKSSPFARLLTWGAIVGLVLLVVRYAWMSDDAYITLRTIDNVWHGYGLRWNILERTQTFTHPLWMLLIGAAYGVTREPYYTTLALSGACLAGTIAWLVTRLPAPQAAVAVLLLATSRAFVDYSSSGLENPLSHLLLTGFCLVFLAGESSPARFRTLAWLAAGCALTRLDLALLVAPALLAEGARLGVRAAWPTTALAALPLVLWHGFTLFYYGSLVPNTALAKLNTGLPAWELVQQGLRYLGESAANDFVTLPAIALAAGAALWRAGRDGDRSMRTGERWLAGGALASLTYIVCVGGDFMSGRFLTAPFLVCAILLARHARQPATAGTLAAAVLALACLSPRSTLRPWDTSDFAAWEAAIHDPGTHGIVDERRVYFQFTGFVKNVTGQSRVTEHPWASLGMVMGGRVKAVLLGSVGLSGYYAGPSVHIIDEVALGDPFLARLRLARGQEWRPGHFRRGLPAGYEASARACLQRLYVTDSFEPTMRSCVEFGDAVNLVEDAALRAVYADVVRATQAPLFDAARGPAIWRLATMTPFEAPMPPSP